MSVEFACCQSRGVKRISERLSKTRVGDPLVGPADPVRSSPDTSQGKRKIRLRKGSPLPQADEETRKGIVAAYRETCKDVSTDQLLCNPDLNASFIDACRQRSLPGDAFVWNRLLLRIRKSGELPRSKQTRKRYSFETMDCYSFASEIAMQLMFLDYGLKFDDVLCRPTAAAEFDQLAASFAPGYAPFDYRWAALAIRKRATKSRELAKRRFRSWFNNKLPRAMPLDRFVDVRYERPGVYILNDDAQALYVGETCNLRNRVDNMLLAPRWLHLNASSLKFVPHDDQALHGLQSMLIYRVNPFLNSDLLRPNLTAVV